MYLQSLSRKKKYSRSSNAIRPTHFTSSKTSLRISFSITKKKSGQYLCLHVYHIVFKSQVLLVVFTTLSRSFWSIGSCRLKSKVKKNTNKVAEMCALIQLYLHIKISMHTQKGSLNSDKYQVAPIEDFHLSVLSCTTFWV